MKRRLFYLIGVLVFSLSMFSCSSEETNEVENVIPYSELPTGAQNFLSNNFGGSSNVAKVEKVADTDIVIYNVETKDGYEIVFNSGGFWQQIDAPEGKSVPMGILPEPIVATLNYQYHGYGVVEVNTEGENYHLVLSNNQGGDSIELTFNQSGEIVSTGSM